MTKVGRVDSPHSHEGSQVNILVSCGFLGGFSIPRPVHDFL